MDKRICKRCLIDELDHDETYADIKRYINDYPEEKRVPEEIYSERLSICKACSELENGICRKCGCFVELRALKKNMYCASEEKKWRR